MPEDISGFESPRLAAPDRVRQDECESNRHARRRVAADASRRKSTRQERRLSREIAPCTRTSHAREAARRVRQGQLHGPITLSVGPGRTVLPLEAWTPTEEAWRMAFTFPDRPSPPVTFTTPATDPRMCRSWTGGRQPLARHSYRAQTATVAGSTCPDQCRSRC